MNALNGTEFEWAVVGAGPAGIASVGKLLDSGVSAERILWCDPAFKVGDLGAYWSHVSSNTRVKLFTQFLQACNSFEYDANNYSMSQLNPDDTCTLSYVVDPLQKITDVLCQKVATCRGLIDTLVLSRNMWELSNSSVRYRAKNVILATGASPSTLNYPGVDVIPFEQAIDKSRLESIVNKKFTYGVFGASHSSIIIIRYLVELGVKNVINFYRSPCRYATDMGDWILFDNSGLKGDTARWAREHIDGVLPPNLTRCNTTQANISRYLPQCDRVIYAVGFQKRNNLRIGDYEDVHHNPHVGIIGPGLFGFGIAYPELKTDPFGTVESQVGLWKFMTYLERVLPVWFRYST